VASQVLHSELRSVVANANSKIRISNLLTVANTGSRKLAFVILPRIRRFIGVSFFVSSVHPFSPGLLVGSAEPQHHVIKRRRFACMDLEVELRALLFLAKLDTHDQNIAQFRQGMKLNPLGLPQYCHSSKDITARFDSRSHRH
jgi:hypothetical protein